ncbi:MAG TPA: hypothetical protein VJ124_06560 [Pyrinomonadaceae bacterium]|nr:hypothetical protein [Pyrinomonadaceae bacterium]
MKPLIGITFCLCMLPAITYAQEPSNRAPLIMAPERFDQWGDIRLNDENARLDKLAIQAKEWPLSIIYLFIHAGKTACAGEAKARGIRAKNYLVHQGVSSERIVLTDAGWRKEVSVQVWIWPPELGKPKIPSEFDLELSAVKLERHCKIKYRGRMNP